MAIGSQLENVFVYLKRPDTHLCERNITACESIQTPAQAHALGGVTWNYGSFLQNLINFFFVAVLIFSMIRSMIALQRHYHAIMHRVRHQGSMPSLKPAAPRARWKWAIRKLKGDSITETIASPPLSSPCSMENVHDAMGGKNVTINAGRVSTSASVLAGQSAESLHTQPNPIPTKDKWSGKSSMRPPGSLMRPGAPAASGITMNASKSSKKMRFRECPFCLMDVPVLAMRCAYCTSDLTDVQIAEETWGR
ncbi:hypothetical protein BC829DRAFT_116714 [Chytridium lagenaria]|nr:hypothetical protein BC829DRAFT_116714 [Chytridium lagenaria]